MIKIVELSKKYGESYVLEDINLTISDNTCLALIGKNGVGKTTLLNILINNISPTSGYIEFDNIKILENFFLKKKIGISFGTEYLIDEFTGLEYLYFINLTYKNEILKSETLELFNYFFEDDFDKNKLIGNYSQGMKTKLSICAAVIHKPEILILDEPFANLDPFAVEKIITFLSEFKKNRIVIFSSHELSNISKLATKICLLDNNKILFHGSLEDFTNHGEKNIDKSLFNMLQPLDVSLDSLNFILK